MNKLNFSKKNLLKQKEALTKVNLCREKIKKRELEMRADLEEARKIWIELSQKFKWWFDKGGLA